MVKTPCLLSSMAVDYPLVLFDCHFDGLSWTEEKEDVNHTLTVLRQHWTQSAIKARVLYGMLHDLEEKGRNNIRT